MRAFSLLLAAAASLHLLAAEASADDTCSEAAGGECDAAVEIIDMAEENPVVDATDAPEEAQEALESQDDYMGGSSEDE